MRLGKTQRLVVQFLREAGGTHVCLGPSVRAGCLMGYTWEEVSRSLDALIKRGIVVEVKWGFYTLPTQGPESARSRGV
jgi:hypothetical protein